MDSLPPLPESSTTSDSENIILPTHTTTTVTTTDTTNDTANDTANAIPTANATTTDTTTDTTINADTTKNNQSPVVTEKPTISINNHNKTFEYIESPTSTVGHFNDTDSIINKPVSIQHHNQNTIERKVSKYELEANIKTDVYTGSEYESDDGGENGRGNRNGNGNGNGNGYYDDSDSEHDNETNSVHKQFELREIMNKIPPPRKIGFNEVKDVVRSTFFSDEDYNSTAFDIIATYIKGQKIIYMEAMSHCVYHLNILMLPTIMLSAVASVLSLTIDTYVWGPIIVACVNAFNGFLLAVVNYSKLDAASEAHKISSHQYDKLQSLCEFTSGKLMMTNSQITNKSEEIATIRKTMDEIEAKIKDIKETNSFVIPSTIRTRFINIYHLNIFSVVKKIRDQEALLINKLKTHINRVRSLEYLYKIGLIDNELELTDNINDLNEEINYINNQIISIKTKFTMIDKMFKQEIRRAEVLKRRGWFISSCCYTIDDIDEHEYITSSNVGAMMTSTPNKKSRYNSQTLVEAFERNTKSMIR